MSNSLNRGNTAAFRASPSLALTKYWGKADWTLNLPATPSVAVTLGGLYSETSVELWHREDEVSINGEKQDTDRYRIFFDSFRERFSIHDHFKAKSRNTFPTAAGIASSSSGFAALTCAAAGAAKIEAGAAELSAAARIGSASAARSIFPGFVFLDTAAEHAEMIAGADHWPDFAVLIVIVKKKEKGLSSRKAMEITERSSPYYQAWLSDSRKLSREALEADRNRDMEKLGSCARFSAYRMHATLIAANPVSYYFLPETIAVRNTCRVVREEGIGAWETMDAGPQVKIICQKADGDRISERIKVILPQAEMFFSSPGRGPEGISVDE